MAADEVLSLLSVLRDARSPVTKAKLVGRLVGELRNLGKDERLALLSRLGIEKADQLVDRLDANTDTSTTALLRQMLRRAERTGPAQWRELVDDIRNPEERERLVERGLELLQEAEPQEAQEECDETALPEEPLAQPVTATRKPPRLEAPAAVERVAGEPDIIARPSVPPEPPVPAKSQVAEETVPSEPPLQAPVTRVPVRKPALEALEPTELIATGPERARVPPPTEPIGLVTDLTRNWSLVRRLGLLRDRLNEAADLGSDGLRMILETFPVGWARRRALSVLLEAGLPPALDAALALVEETQERVTDRLWCLGVLADSRALSPSEQTLLLESAGASTWRRRLARRLEASA